MDQIKIMRCFFKVAHNSIFAMGLLGAGTNNARLAAMLRQVIQILSDN